MLSVPELQLWFQRQSPVEEALLHPEAHQELEGVGKADLQLSDL